MNIVPSYSFFRNRMWNIRMAVGLLIITMVAMSTYVFAAIGDQADAALKFSSSADRSGAQTLQNKTLAGNVYIFADVGTVASVYFYMDPKVGDLSLIRASSKELYTPYDFGHTIAAGTAKAFDTKRLADGVHRLDVVVTSLNGAKTTHRADFTVKNTVATTTAPTTTKAPVTTVAPPTTKAPVTTAAPAPSNNKNCANLPSACGYPDATNTGVPAGTVLTRVPEDKTSGPGWFFDTRGWVEINVAGTVLSGITTKYAVDIQADNVTIKNSRIQVGFDDWPVAIRHAKGTIVQNNTLSGNNATTGRGLVGVKTIYGDESNTTVIGNNISWTATGVQIYAGTIKDNYIHDMGFVSGDHTNGTTSNGGTTEQLNIVHNTIFNSQGQTDAISLFEDFGVEKNRLIDNNLVAGGGYCIYGGQNAGGQLSTNVKITNNRFSRKYFPNCGSYGPLAAYNANASGNLWSGNVWDDTLASVGS